jgi:predicted anti-sigma-YlaC factor YlaD
MPPINTGTGKGGTLSPEHFETLSEMVAASGAKLLATKVAKICLKKSEALKHEYANSSIAAGYAGVATKLTGVVGTGTRAITRASFDALTSMVAAYGPEVVVQKLAKIAKRNNNVADATALKGIFPKAA